MRLIDADALSYNLDGMTAVSPTGYIHGDTVADMIGDAPTIEPEREKGKWIEIALSNHTYKCSACGRLLVNITDGWNSVAKNYPYCHCGADMRGEKDD